MVRHAGLPNVGNTCYLNTCVQLFFSCLHRFPPHYFKQLANPTNVQVVVIHLSNLYIQTQNPPPPIRPTPPIQMYPLIGAIGASPHCNIQLNNQNDSMELFFFFLDRFHEGYSQTIDPTRVQLPQIANPHIRKICTEHLQKSFSKEFSLFHDLFYGIIVDHIQGPNNYSSLVPEQFCTIDLHMLPTPCNIEFLLHQHFCCTETIEDIGKTKRTHIAKLPYILVITIKRFNYMTQQKNTTAIQIPLILDMNPYLLEAASAQPTKYKLFGMANHFGNSYNNGHYTASIYDNDAGVWNYYNDEQVFTINDLNEGAFPITTPYVYALFYQVLM